MFHEISEGGWKGYVDAEADLPSVGNSLGDARAAIAEESIYLWNGSLWVSTGGSGGGGTWGSITGTLSDQLDLQTALDLKIGGSTGATDNRLLRSDGTGTKTLQTTGITVDDSDGLELPAAAILRFWPSADNFRVVRLTSALWLYANQGGAGFGLDSSGYYFNRPLPLYFGNQSASGTDESILIKDAAGGQLLAGQNFLIRAMNQANTGAGAHGGGVKIYGGNQTNASASSNGGDVTLKGGDVTNTGTGGGVNLQEGTSGAGTRGLITIGRTASSSRIRINSLVGTAGADALTLSNGPTGTAGDPDIYLRMNVNGTDYVFPGWAV
jgi:hypothetical protein